MFRPPFCPNEGCVHHRAPDRAFFVRRGYYRARCRRQRVPRFRCKACGKFFSRQTFRADFREHRPGLNKIVLSLIASGVGLREIARVLGVPRKTVRQKAHKLARAAVEADANLQRSARIRAIRAGVAPADAPSAAVRGAGASGARTWSELGVAVQRSVRDWTERKSDSERRTPAELEFGARRRLTRDELVRWRQDWGQRSPDPFHVGGRGLIQRLARDPGRGGATA